MGIRELNMKRRINRMKKRILKGITAILFSLVLVISYTGCGSNSDSGEIQNNENTGSEATGSEEIKNNDNDDSGEKQNNDEGESSTASDNNTIRVAIQPGQYTFYTALENGYFDEEGINVEYSTFSYGPPIIEAITAGDIDTGFLGDQPAFSAIANDVDITLVGAYIDDVLNHGLVASDQSGIESLEDLKGKTISVPFGSNAQPLLYIYLEAAGLTENDVEIVNLAYADSEASLLSGDVDASVTGGQYIYDAIQEGSGLHLVTTSEGYKQYVNPIIVSTDFAKENREVVVKYLRALSKAADWIEEHHQEAADITYSYDEVKVESTLYSLDVSNINIALTKDRIQALIEGAAQSYQYELIPEEINIEDYIDTSFGEEAGIH